MSGMGETGSLQKSNAASVRKNFSGYKVKTGIPYTLMYLHEASGIYGPKTLEIPG
jgi:hypothetical protein